MPVRPAAIRREIPPAGSSLCGAPSRPARVTGGASFGPISHGSQMNKKPNLVPGLVSSFLGFWSSKSVLGARVSFGIPNYVYIGSRVVFG